MSRIELHWPTLHGLLAMAGHNAVAGFVNNTHWPQPVCVWVKTATPVGLGSQGMQGTEACETKVATPVGLGSPGMPGTEANRSEVAIPVGLGSPGMQAHRPVS